MMNMSSSPSVPVTVRCPNCHHELLSADLPVDLVRRTLEPNAPARLLSVRKAAERLGVSRSTFYTLLGRDRLRLSASASESLVPTTELERFIQDGG